MRIGWVGWEGNKSAERLLVQASQQRDLGCTVHKSFKQPQHGSCRRLGQNVCELTVSRNVFEVDEAESQRIPNEIGAEREVPSYLDQYTGRLQVVRQYMYRSSYMRE